MQIRELIILLVDLMQEHGNYEIFYEYDGEYATIKSVMPVPRPRYTMHDPKSKKIGAFLITSE